MRDSFNPGPFLKRIWQNTLSLATNKFFAAGILVLIGLMALGYFMIDRVIMPAYVGHDVSVAVPNVQELPVEEAQLRLQELSLQVEVKSSRYNPQLPRDIVIDQNPGANMRVKPGRRIYLTINTGATPEATVPSLEGISLDEARNRLFAAGLKAEKWDIRPDSIPSPYPNTVTRQSPEAGTIVEEGSRVRLWYSTGIGDRYVGVPDVSGMTINEAQRSLLRVRLRSIVLGVGSEDDASSFVVVRQSPFEGTRIKEGSEIRLFVEVQEEEAQ